MGINIERWHDDLGFGNNALDFDAPHELSETDLMDLGIGLGDRKPLLRAIATLAADDGPGGMVQPAVAGIHDFTRPFASPSAARAPRAA